MTKYKYLLIIGIVGFLAIFGFAAFGYIAFSAPDKNLINNFTVGDENQIINTSVMTININEALEGAYMDVVIDDEHYITIKVSNTSFEISDIPVAEGNHSIQLTQRISSLLGDSMSNQKKITTIVDTTAPSADIELIGDYPSITNANKLSLKYRIKGDGVAKIKVAGTSSDIVAGFDERGIDVTLHDGNNSLVFTVIDEHGNEHITDTSLSILRDNDPAKIYTSTYLCGLSGTSNFQPNEQSNTYEEKVCIQMGQFYGPLTGSATAPITGKVVGNITSVSFDGKTLQVNNDLSINQRIPVYVRHGSNNYEIKVIDKAGNVSTSLYPLEWISDEERAQESDDEVIDRLDDLESQIEDLQ